MECGDTLEDKGQLQRYCNQDFIGPHYSKMLTHLSRLKINDKEQEIIQAIMKYP